MGWSSASSYSGPDNTDNDEPQDTRYVKSKPECESAFQEWVPAVEIPYWRIRRERIGITFYNWEFGFLDHKRWPVDRNHYDISGGCTGFSETSIFSMDACKDFDQLITQNLCESDQIQNVYWTLGASSGNEGSRCQYCHQAPMPQSGLKGDSDVKTECKGGLGIYTLRRVPKPSRGDYWTIKDNPSSKEAYFPHHGIQSVGNYVYCPHTVLKTSVFFAGAVQSPDQYIAAHPPELDEPKPYKMWLNLSRFFFHTLQKIQEAPHMQIPAPSFESTFIEASIFKYLDLGLSAALITGWFDPQRTPNILGGMAPIKALTISELRSRADKALSQRARNLTQVDTITNPYDVPPRRLWDLKMNRVIPWYLIDNSHARSPPPFIAISHSWVNEEDRILVRTPINGYAWTVPLPKGTDLHVIRQEILEAFPGFRYCWLDILCLRQPVPELAMFSVLRSGRTLTDSRGLRLTEALCLEKDRSLSNKLCVFEHRIDVPTIGNVYKLAKGVFRYYNGLGRRFCDTSWEHPNHWFNRAWTLQETVPGSVDGGVKGWKGNYLNLEGYRGGVKRRLREFVTEIENMAGKTASIIELSQEMGRRYATNNIDKITGLSYLLEMKRLPTYKADIEVDHAWRRSLQEMPKKYLLELLFNCPVVDSLLWVPRWSDLSMLPPTFVPYPDLDQMARGGNMRERFFSLGLELGNPKSVLGDMYEQLSTRYRPLKDTTVCPGYPFALDERHSTGDHLNEDPSECPIRMRKRKLIEEKDIHSLSGNDSLPRLPRLSGNLWLPSLPRLSGYNSLSGYDSLLGNLSLPSPPRLSRNNPEFGAIVFQKKIPLSGNDSLSENSDDDSIDDGYSYAYVTWVKGVKAPGRGCRHRRDREVGVRGWYLEVLSIACTKGNDYCTQVYTSGTHGGTQSINFFISHNGLGDNGQPLSKIKPSENSEAKYLLFTPGLPRLHPHWKHSSTGQLGAVNSTPARSTNFESHNSCSAWLVLKAVESARGMYTYQKVGVLRSDETFNFGWMAEGLLRAHLRSGSIFIDSISNGTAASERPRFE